MQLTPKESSLIKDLKDQEQLCIDKYQKHSSCAKDEQLKTLFTQIAAVEKTHLDTLTKLEQGNTAPGGNEPAVNKTFSAKYTVAPNPDKDNDAYLCSDVLAGEKHVSSLYDTCIFEFKDDNARNILNHIQKEEQEHGKIIYDYMTVNSMYS
ncbi:MAG: ferritin-like domain-containing protein [Clostridia bacterium]|nr:ferritin-like domain-containing protein [Clostridia bacterium]